MTALDELQKTITDVSTRVGPSVVGIGSRLRGSGVVIADGKILTNAHNVRGGEVTINFAGGRSTRGKLAGIDVAGDGRHAGQARGFLEIDEVLEQQVA